MASFGGLGMNHLERTDTQQMSLTPLPPMVKHIATDVPLFGMQDER